MVKYTVIHVKTFRENYWTWWILLRLPIPTIMHTLPAATHSPSLTSSWERHPLGHAGKWRVLIWASCLRKLLWLFPTMLISASVSAAQQTHTPKIHTVNLLILFFKSYQYSPLGWPAAELNGEIITTLRWSFRKPWAELSRDELGRGETQPATFGSSWEGQSSAEPSWSGQGWVEAKEHSVVRVWIGN